MYEDQTQNCDPEIHEEYLLHDTPFPLPHHVRPLLESASPVWSPQYKHLIDKVESVQRRFTKWLPGYSTLDYPTPTRLTSLEQCSLEKRRIVHDLNLMYKFVFSLVDVQTSNFITPQNDAVPTKGPYKVFTALHEMQTRSSDENSVRLSVCPSVCQTRNL